MKLTKEEKKILRGYVLHQISEHAGNILGNTLGLPDDLSALTLITTFLHTSKKKEDLRKLASLTDQLVNVFAESYKEDSKEVLLTLASHDEYCEVFKNL